MGQFKTRPKVEIRSMTYWRIMRQRIKEEKISVKGIVDRHYTTSCKLYSAKNHQDKLSKMIPNITINDLPIKVYVDEKGIAEAIYPDLETFKEKTIEYLEHFEGFFYSLRGSLDSYFWELNLVFGLGLDRISYHKVKHEMKKKHNSKETTKILQKLGREQWFKYLSNVRNELTHHILSELVTYTEDKKIYLPSDPIKNEYSRKEEFEVITRLTYLREKVFQFLESGYRALMLDLNLYTPISNAESFL